MGEVPSQDNGMVTILFLSCIVLDHLMRMVADSSPVIRYQQLSSLSCIVLDHLVRMVADSSPVIRYQPSSQIEF